MILDLFAGPGGWSEGIRSLGLHDVGLEWGRDACLTRAAAGHKTVRCDVSKYPVEPFVGKVRGLIASPPCQAFSMAGNRLGMLDLGRIHAAVEAARSGWRDELREGEWADPRSALILEPLRWAWSLKPEWIACEQVPPALKVWEHMADVLRSWGYDATAVRLLAADYGVPQTRLRAFLLAHRTRVNVPAPTHAKNPLCDLFGNRLELWVSMAEALGWEPGGMAIDRRVGGFAEGADVITDDRPAPTLSHSHSREVWVRTSFGKPKDDARNGKHEIDPSASPAHTVTGKTGDWTLRTGNNTELGGGRREPYERSASEPAPVVDGKVGHRMNDVRWVHERPATTVAGGFLMGGDKACVIPPPGHRDMGEDGPSRQDAEGSVRIELHEAAILQSFPADYPFQGTKTARFRQVGDAVCPRLAAAVVGALQ